METRAHHLLIGSFVLLSVAGLAAAVLWIAGTDLAREESYYDIFFKDSVAGLSVGGDVRYRGIKVGTVTGIGIKPDDPTRARVTVEVGSTPIREGDQATLALQGITGVLFVNIEGASQDRPLIKAEPGQRHPVIPSKPSTISEVFEGVPDLMTAAVAALDRLSGFASEENQTHIAGILANVDHLTAALAARDEQVGQILERLEGSMGDLEAAGGSLRATLETAHGLVDEEGRRITADLEGTLGQLRDLVASAQGVVEENREPLQEFSSRGLGELTAVAGEARVLLTRLTQLTERLDREGAGVLLAAPPREIEVAP
jgi:phospholipid/cholesterol/gamma-HCH transport system substrate-binding protein